MAKEVLDLNRIEVIGELVEVDLKTAEARNGKEYIGGNIVVKSIIEGQEQLTDINLFAFQTTKAGTDNQFYKSYSELEDWIGERVSVDGELDENRFHSDRNDQIVSTVRNRGKFVNKAKKDDSDKAEFKFAGYVVKPLVEKTDKEGNVLYYEIIVGKKDYSGKKPIYITFAVDPAKDKAISFMEEYYETGETVRIVGDISIVREKKEVVKESAFGGDEVEVYDNVYRRYEIVRGSEPLDEKKAYEISYIKELAETYKKIGRDLKENANESASSDSSSKNKSNKKKGSKSDLQDLI